MTGVCPKCRRNIEENVPFCPHCGFQLNQENSISKVRGIKIYVISFLFAPFGLYWFFKYRNDKNLSNRLISKRVLWITVIAIVIMLIAGLASFKTYKSLLDGYMMPLYLY